MSVLLRPKIPMTKAIFITVACAVAVCAGVKRTCDIDTGIKWVNDVFVEDKKLCGILTEATVELETNSPEYVVAGIGINVDTEQFPQELADIATSLKLEGGECDVNELTAEILGKFYDMYVKLPETEFLDEYRALSCVLGKQVTLPGGTQATATDINDDANLVVVTRDGDKRVLSSGEISIKRAIENGELRVDN